MTHTKRCSEVLASLLIGRGAKSCSKVVVNLNPGPGFATTIVDVKHTLRMNKKKMGL